MGETWSSETSSVRCETCACEIAEDAPIYLRRDRFYCSIVCRKHCPRSEKTFSCAAYAGQVPIGDEAAAEVAGDAVVTMNRPGLTRVGASTAVDLWRVTSTPERSAPRRRARPASVHWPQEFSSKEEVSPNCIEEVEETCGGAECSTSKAPCGSLLSDASTECSSGEEAAVPSPADCPSDQETDEAVPSQNAPVPCSSEESLELKPTQIEIDKIGHVFTHVDGDIELLAQICKLPLDRLKAKLPKSDEEFARFLFAGHYLQDPSESAKANFRLRVKSNWAWQALNMTKAAHKSGRIETKQAAGVANEEVARSIEQTLNTSESASQTCLMQ